MTEKQTFTTDYSPYRTKAGRAADRERRRVDAAHETPETTTMTLSNKIRLGTSAVVAAAGLIVAAKYGVFNDSQKLDTDYPEKSTSTTQEIDQAPVDPGRIFVDQNEHSR